MTGKNLDPYMGRAFLADGVCTTLSGSVGGTGMNTYAENIGVMAVTKVYSTTIFVVAGVFAILLGLSPKFGAVISTIPVALLGGASVVVLGLVRVVGVHIWVATSGAFTMHCLVSIAAVSFVMGAGNFSLHIGSFDLGGIGTATLAAIILNLCLNRGEDAAEKVNSSTEESATPVAPH